MNDPNLFPWVRTHPPNQGNAEAARGSTKRSQLRFLQIICPANHILLEVIPGLDGPVLLRKGATTGKARPATRLADLMALGPDAAVRCQCECSTHDVLTSWVGARLAAGVVRVVWNGSGTRPGRSGGVDT